MIHTWLCIGCGGVYTDHQQDGSRYFHVCAPLGPDEFGDYKQRPGHRDENPRLTSTGQFLSLTAEGQGLQCLSNKALTEPAWIAAAKAKAEKEDDDDA